MTTYETNTSNTPNIDLLKNECLRLKIDILKGIIEGMIFILPNSEYTNKNIIQINGYRAKQLHYGINTLIGNTNTLVVELVINYNNTKHVHENENEHENNNKSEYDNDNEIKTQLSHLQSLLPSKSKCVARYFAYDLNSINHIFGSSTIDLITTLKRAKITIEHICGDSSALISSTKTTKSTKCTNWNNTTFKIYCDELDWDVTDDALFQAMNYIVHDYRSSGCMKFTAHGNIVNNIKNQLLLINKKD